MKKKFRFLAAASAITLLGACTDETVPSVAELRDAAPENNAIAFGTYMGRMGATRAGAPGAIGTDTLKGIKYDNGIKKWTEANAKNYGFGVFAYYTGAKNFSDYKWYKDGSTEKSVANFMFNQQVWWNDNLSNDYVTKWTYTPLKYWPNEVTGYSWLQITIPTDNAGEAPTEATEGTLNQVVKHSGKYYWLKAISGSTYTWQEITVPTDEVSGVPTATTSGTVGTVLKNGENYYLLTGINGVDDQDNDKFTDPATTTYKNGGNLTFFAYAPYVLLGTDDIDTSNGGITAINGAKTLAGANGQAYEPYLTYVLAKDGTKVVDLLWGTAGTTSTNVNNVLPTFTTGTNESDVTSEAKAASENSKSYAANLLNGYKTNTDLTKQRTNGTVGFAFKHALAKVGGGNINTNGGDNVKNGLMVVLDLDDLKGAETGGTKEDDTKVTVRSVKVVARTLIKNDNKKPGDEGYVSTYLTTPSGDFNLATGIWKIDATNTTTEQPTDANSTVSIVDQQGPRETDGTNVTGELNANIKEPYTTGGSKVNSWEKADGMIGLPVGVLTTAQNIYEDGTDAYPLVFIPGTYPELTITIDYLVRTKDVNLSDKASGGEGTWTKVEQVITKKLTFTEAVKLNKQYSIIMHLGLTGVKFTAEVSDWSVAGDDDNNGEIDGTEKLKVEDVYLPINVGGLMVTMPTTLGSDAKTLALTNAYYYKTNDDGESEKSNDVKSDLTVSATPVISDWMGSLSSGTFSFEDNKGNETLKDRTATFQLMYAPTSGDDKDVKIYSEYITVTQHGRIPESIKLAWTPEPELTDKAAAGGDVNIDLSGATTKKASGKESKADGTASDTPFSDKDFEEDYELVFMNSTTDMTPASWITMDGNKVKTVAANGTGEARTAYLYARVNGYLVPVKKEDSTQYTLTQKEKD